MNFRWAMDVSTDHPNHENLKTNKIYISHDVTNFEFLYEPFYVAKDIVPPHDERFMGYGYTRNTQVKPFKFYSNLIQYVTLQDKRDIIYIC